MKKEAGNIGPAKKPVPAANPTLNLSREGGGCDSMMQRDIYRAQEADDAEACLAHSCRTACPILHL